MTKRKPAKSHVPSHSSAKLAEDLSHLPKTKCALLFHEARGKLALVTAHGVSLDNAGLPHLGPGRPMTPFDEHQIANLLLSREQDLVEIYPENLMAKSEGMLMWWLPPIVRPMYLKNEKNRGTRITTRWPNLVLLVVGRKLSVVAVKGLQRPSARSQIYHAPLGNVYADSGVCTGTASLPAGCRNSHMAGWERVMVETYFTSNNHPATLASPSAPVSKSKRGANVQTANPGQSNYSATEFWSARDGDDSPFPDDRLSPLKGTLADWVGICAGVKISPESC